MAKLTVNELKALKPGHVGTTVRDDGGLWGKVRGARDSVSVTFWYRYRWEGKTRDTACGTWPATGLPTIRAARDAARDLVAQGIDPNEQRRTDRIERQVNEATRTAELEEKLARLTVQQLFDRWMKLELANRKDKGAETKRGFEKDVLSALGARHADSITRADVMAVLDGVKERGANRLANRLLSELRQMFGFALVRDIVTNDPTHRIAKRDVGGKDTERDRVFSEAEIRALPSALAAANLLKSTVHAVWLMLSTGARIGEATRARRTDFDLDAGTWTIPKEHAKNQREHVIYLSDFARRHVEALLALSDDEVWVMPARRGKGSVCSKSMTKQIEDRQLAHYKRQAHTNRTAHAHALELTGGKWTPHDLRRTAGTLMGELGVDSDVIIKCLNQTEEHKVKRVYQRQVRLNDQIDAWRRLGERLDLLTRADAANVATLPARKTA
ncbi:site-specific integrase [Paraburkholderia sp. RAU2J]|uniref:tyrosine-type recombinase/integrase n=1 Tax=Paraburkholderia sp. RAU2J TaxID=1938810 RepID=UPI000EAF3272|nr:site-specific integrase [Paraburkholderia sp. RAU2J]